MADINTPHYCARSEARIIAVPDQGNENLELRFRPPLSDYVVSNLIVNIPHAGFVVDDYLTIDGVLVWTLSVTRGDVVTSETVEALERILDESFGLK